VILAPLGQQFETFSELGGEAGGVIAADRQAAAFFGAINWSSVKKV